MESHPGDTLGTRFLTFWGVIVAFFGFALFAMLLQRCSSGLAGDPRTPQRLANLEESRNQGLEDLKKLGWADGSPEMLSEAVKAVAARAQKETKVVVPGSETANKLAAEAAAAEPSKEKEGAEGAGDGDAPSVETGAPKPGSAPDGSAPETAPPAATAPEAGAPSNP